MNDGVLAFVETARHYCEWARASEPTGPEAVAQALRQITSLYLAGLSLPGTWSPDLDVKANAGLVSDDERLAVVAAAARLPLANYSEVFDPVPVPPDESVIGDLGDDIADIYCDVATGLRLYDAGRQAEAIWEWSFGLQNHWGAHATSAIRALHWYLVEKRPGLLVHGA